MKIIVSAGGSAGHVIPLLEIALALKRRGHRVVYVGAGRPESQLVRGVAYRQIVAGKWRRYVSLQNFIDLIKAAIGCVQAFALVARIKPNFIFVKGGYVSFPVIVAAWLQRVALYVHESDIVMGFTNRLAARIARLVFVGFPVDQYPGVPKDKLVHSGIPVRAGFDRPPSSVDRNLFELKSDQPVLLVTGGSQGAQGLNRLVFSILSPLVERYQLIHLTGRQDFAEAIDRRNRLPIRAQERYHVYKSLAPEMPAAVRVADVVLTRAGATILAEITAAGKKAVLVPLPSAASDHQSKNAEYYAKAAGFIVIDQATASAKELLAAIVELLRTRAAIAKPPDAVKIIVERLPLQKGHQRLTL